MFFVFLLSTLILSIGCNSTQAEKPKEPVSRDSQKARDFEAEDINGRKFKLSDYKGKVIILNFFATWCPPCRAEMPDFNEIQKEYHDSVKIIAINIGGEAIEKVRMYAISNNLDFTIAMNDGNIGRLYGPITAIPVTIIIDPDFNVARRYIGMRRKEAFISDIEELKK